MWKEAGMSTSDDVQTRTVSVPGASLYVETLGSGPMLLCISGGPTDAGMFADLARRLAHRYTVVSYDQRGHSRSPLEGEPTELTPGVHAEDAAAIIRELSPEEPASVYGVSGGGTIGLALVEAHPELVRVLVAAEPPLMELLPDADEWRARFDDIVETYRREGAFPGMGKFGAAVEEGGPLYSQEMANMPSTPEGEAMGQRMMGNFDLFLAHELVPIGRFQPDVERLRSVPTRIVSVAGEASGEQAARRAAIALSERLGIPVTSFPGAHGGWGSDPQRYADRLDEVLRAS
jgi:pimeloyl-ACP methyl ester carboxylesterase